MRKSEALTLIEPLIVEAIAVPNSLEAEGIRDATAYDPTDGTVRIGCVFRRSGGESY